MYIHIRARLIRILDVQNIEHVYENTLLLEDSRRVGKRHYYSMRYK